MYTDPSGHKQEVSIVDYLKKQKQDSSFAARKEIAEDLKIKNYTGTATQNTQMLNMLKEQKAEAEAKAAAIKVSQEKAMKEAAVMESAAKVKDSDEVVTRLQNSDFVTISAGIISFMVEIKIGIQNQPSDLEDAGLLQQLISWHIWLSLIHY